MSRKLLNSAVLAGVPAATVDEIAKVVTRTLHDVILHTVDLSNCLEHEQGMHTEKAGGGGGDSDSDGSEFELPTFSKLTLGVRHVDTVLLTYIDGDDLLLRVKQHKPTGPPLVDGAAKLSATIDTMASEKRRGTGLDHAAKARIHALLDLLARRILHPSDSPSPVDRLVSIANSYDYLEE